MLLIERIKKNMTKFRIFEGFPLNTESEGKDLLFSQQGSILDARGVRRYGHSKSFHCNSCDSRLICPRAACRNTECPLLGWLHCSVTPKRCKASKRTTIHFLQIEPQLSLILGRVL
ncbi:hypothetical protein COOONC_06928 [Cooperia oncophora]